MKTKMREDRGSLSLEQVLFIGAIVIIAGGLTNFYSEIGQYFSTTSFGNGPDYGTATAPPAAG